MTRKVPVALPDGRQAQAVEVPVESSNEKWSEFTLQDGSIVRVKVNVVSVLRVENEYDPQGMPLYQVNAQPAFALAHVPDDLKRKRQ